jgi:hypothetical protein
MKKEFKVLRSGPPHTFGWTISIVSKSPVYHVWEDCESQEHLVKKTKGNKNYHQTKNRLKSTPGSPTVIEFEENGVVRRRFMNQEVGYGFDKK